ncbi:MAG TPA: hypothetical protein VLF68_00840 [Candidatus Saccharimonadales bacterium]|nr:hypothetical protein [Candidatus Saccharimonadales bacterium]
MKKLLTLFLLAAVLLLGSAATAYATSTTCQPIYGGGQNCVSTGLTLTKMVQNPQTGAFVNNLSANDPRFSPGQTVNFQLSVTNNGSTQIGTVTVKDTFPQFVTFASGPGTFDSGSNTLTFTMTNLAAGETRTVNLSGTVAGANSLPSDQGITCPVNQANATADNGQTAQASSQLCIQKQGVPTANVPTKGGLTVFPAPTVTTTPPTGPEALALLGLIPTAAAGFVLRKKS